MWEAGIFFYIWSEVHKPDLVSVPTLHQQADGAGVRGAAGTFHTTRVVARVLHLRVREDQHAPVVQEGCLLGDGAVISPPGVQQGKPGARQVCLFDGKMTCTFFPGASCGSSNL